MTHIASFVSLNTLVKIYARLKHSSLWRQVHYLTSGSDTVFASFSECIRAQADRYGDGRFYTFLTGMQSRDVESTQTLSYRALDEAASRMAAQFCARGSARQSALLLYPPGLEFLKAFVACLYAQIIAVPAPLPTDSRSFERLAGIMGDAGICTVLTTTALVGNLQKKLGKSDVSQANFIATDVLFPECGNDWQLPRADPQDVAFLQYTSGSTSAPKGVVVTHDNLLHNQEQIQKVTQGGNEEIVVGWLPHFHDMGLIGMLLHPVYVGGNCIFMSPTTFLKRPVRWLEAISRYKASITVAPDFAYELCARVIDNDALAGLDLSSLKVALNGAEPIRPRTLGHFTERFSPAGFDPRSFVPCYGMAEATLLVTGKSPGTLPRTVDVDAAALDRNQARPAEQDRRSLRLVSSGHATGTELRIVDPQSCQPLFEGNVGEIWLRGRSIARGYWRHSQAHDSFGASTKEGGGGYLRTGDLGFVNDGELYVTGRLKDMLLVNGRNIYPQDVEFFVRDLNPLLGMGANVIFQAGENDAVSVLIQEIAHRAVPPDMSLKQLHQDIHASVTRVFGLPKLEILFAEQGVIRRTTSGKVQRGLMRKLYANGELVPSPGNTGEPLADIGHIERARVPLSA